MEFVILGRTALNVDGEQVDLGSAKQRGLLALLLYHVGQPVRIDMIIDHLWNGHLPHDRRSSLYELASRSRTALARAGAADALLRLPGSGAYRLDVDRSSIDFYRFRRTVGEARRAARQGHHDTAVLLLTDCIKGWKDEPVADLRGPQADHIRLHMNDVLLDAHKLLADSQLSLGQHQAVLDRLEPIMRANELDETLAQHWITALRGNGQEAAARSFFWAFRRRFLTEMGVEPAVEPPALIRREQTTEQAALATKTAPALPPNRVPKDIIDFTGQERPLAELDELTDPDLPCGSIIVITGMPGVGKTTLATHWAHRRRHRFPDGQLFLNCEAHGPSAPVEPADALRRFLEMLEVPSDRIPLGEEQRRNRLNQILAGRRVLIVLDNVRNSDHARRMIPGSGTCVTLITSRTRLKGLTIHEGVRTITVAPLAGAERLSLLVQMIGRARAEAELDAVHALARLADGLPLALRIIGEHVAERPLARIADLLHGLNAQLLDTASEDEEGSLRTVFAWSRRALPRDTARLFGLLGMHPGSSVSPGPSAAMLGVGVDHAEHLLNTLARAHLINHGTARRYTFHDLLRRFAKDCAAREETAQARKHAINRLLNWYVLSAANAADALAPEGPPVPDLPEAAGLEPQVFPTDRAALEWCEMERGNLSTMTRFAADSGFHRHAWQIPGAIHEIFDRYGRQDDLLELHQIALASAKKDHHEIGQVWALNHLGATYFGLRDYRLAAEYWETGLRLAQQIHYVEAEAPFSHNLASVHLRTGRTAAAIRIYRNVLADCQRTGNAFGQASILHRLGDALAQLAEHDQALECYQQALDIRERNGYRREQGMTHGQLAALHLGAGRTELAREHCHRALEIHDQTRDDAALCDSLITMTDIKRELEMYDGAVQDGQRAVTISVGIADSLRRCRALAGLAAAYAASGRPEAARRLCTEAADIANELKEPDTPHLRQRLQAILLSVSPTTGTPYRP